MSAALELRDVDAGYDRTRVVRSVSLHLDQGAFGCLLGPSGCGKTTLLRAVAGFMKIDAGEVRLGGSVVSGQGVNVAPEARGVGMVFQENALFPHLSIEANVGFGLRGRPRADRRAVVGELLDVLGLQGLSRRYPHEISGGQRQRVALARALAPAPGVVLLDEPFSSLDTDLRERIGHEVRDILVERETTALLVTHDQSEAFALGDRIGVMSEGELLQWDTAYNLYHEPADRFVADFVGQGVFLRGELVAPDAVQTELGLLHGNRAYPWSVGSHVDVLLRPDDIQPDPMSEIRATVSKRAFKGAGILYSLRLSTGSSILSLFPSHMNHEEGADVGIRVDADHLVAFPSGS